MRKIEKEELEKEGKRGRGGGGGEEDKEGNMIRRGGTILCYKFIRYLIYVSISGIDVYLQ